MSKKNLIRPLLSLLLVCALIVPLMAAPALAYAPYPLQPEDTEVAGALDYLGEVQAADGSIGSYGDSAWAVMAIAAAGEDASEWGTPSVVDYLKENAALLSGEFNLGTAYARVILAIVAAGEDPTAFGSGDPTYAPDGDYLTKLKELHNGTQFEDGFSNTDTLNDDLWGLMALITAGEPQDSPMVTSTVAFIKDYQGEDGGWSWATFENPWYWESDVDDTAAGIMALVAAGEPQDSLVIEDALFYLQDNQDASGGFLAWGAANLASTAWAVDSIVAAGQDPTGANWAPAGNDPIDYIMTFKKADGSFLDESAWTPNPQKNTADAIVTLLGKPYPVEAPELGYTFEDPRRGTTVTINTDNKTFRFTAPDGYDSGVVEAKFMRVKGARITILHRDAGIRFTCRANINQDFCTGVLLDRANHQRYIIRDPRGVE